jgi:hypothetical protein
MVDAFQAALLATGGGLLAAGVLAQVRTHRLRRQWAEVGMGLEERATGLASIAAIPVLFPAELDTARATGTQLAVLAMRRYSEHPETFGRRLAGATRAHETGWRIDYDLFAVTIVVEDADAAVLAAARIGRAACGEEATRDLRIGIAIAPDDGSDLLDLVDVASRRMRGYGVLEAVAQQLRRLDAGPELVDVAAAG